MKVQTKEQTIKKKRVEWIGHLERMDHERVVNNRITQRKGEELEDVH